MLELKEKTDIFNEELLIIKGATAMDKQQRLFYVRFYSRKANELLHEVFIQAPTDTGIILKGKITALEEGFRYDKRKHVASWCEQD